MGTMGGEMGLYGGLGRQGMSPERRRQATLPVRRHHAAERDRERDGPFPLERGPHSHSHTHRRSNKQRSQSLPRNRDPMPGKLLHTSAHMEERSEDEEAEGQAADMLQGEDGKEWYAHTLLETSLWFSEEWILASKVDIRISFVKDCIMSFKYS